jgi:hypothetical protein
MAAKFSIAFCERFFCYFEHHSLPDMKVRDNRLRKAGLLSRGGHGTSAPRATGTDIVRIAIGLVCSWKATDVVEGYRKVSRFELVSAREEIEEEGTSRKVDPPFPVGSTLEDVLHSCFRQEAACAQAFYDQRALDQPTVDTRVLVRGLQVDHSPVKPRAYLEIEYEFAYATPNARAATWVMTFAGQPEVSEDEDIADVVEYSTRVRNLWTLSSLYADADDLIQFEDDTGSSVAADEPDRVNLKDEERIFQQIVDDYQKITKNLMDRRGAPTPKRRTSD